MTDEENGNDIDDDDDDDESESSPGRLRRKRDRIMNWMASSKTGWKAGSSSSAAAADANRNREKRVKANFGDLFAGMPSMSEILNSGDDNDDTATSTTNGEDTNGKSSSRLQNMGDDAWFDEERRQIETNYDTILRQMIAELEEQRQQDPESIPENAEAMIKDVLQQEMVTEIGLTQEARAKENLEAYGQAQKEAMEAQNVEGVTNDVVDNLMKQDQDAQAIADAAQARVDDYRRYELEAFLKKPNEDGLHSSSNGPTIPVPESAKTEDLDQWALDRLQDMVDARLDGAIEDDTNLLVTDILEDSLEDLQERMEQAAGKTSIRPETMKEWQMYRAISSRLLRTSKEAAGYAGDITTDDQQQQQQQQVQDDIAEEQIAAQLESWKTYIAKEIVIREQSGLARGTKLPFEWQESGRDQELKEAEIRAAMASQGSESQAVKTKVEIRKDVNRKSLQAMERLIQTSDPIRSARLQKDVDLLRQEFEANDYLDIDEALLLEEQAPVLAGPVDISDVFSSTKDSPQLRQTPSMQLNGGSDSGRPQPPSTPFFDQPIDTEKTVPDTPFFSDNNDEGLETRSAPPATPFFSDGGDDGNTGSDDDGPPDTPFFSSQDEQSEGSGYSLGTIDEQKLRSMYQRAGARTDEEKAVIRAQWEDFQKFEQSRRDGSGLTDGDDSSLMNQADLKYDVSEITKEDGDFDAEKILASIGPRPTRKRRTEGASTTSDYVDPSPPEAGIDEAEVSDSLYRAVSAVGGGRTRDDPEAKAKEKAAFSEFMEKEDEMRQSLDDLDEKIAAEVSSEDIDFDETKYAQEALDNLGPRPQKRRKISESEYSDQGIALSDSDDDDDDDDDDDNFVGAQSAKEKPAPIDMMASEDELLPGWVRKERESARNRDETTSGQGAFLGSDIDDVFEDDVYEHNQRQLAEYERRRAGGKKKMGIDISDVLGRSSEDYADYTYDDNYFRGKQSGWGSGGFESRKENLMDYIELNVIELNALMDHKDSVHSTGVSQYLPRINKPFKEFGALFRLEGVLLDTTGFQYKAWSKVALEKGFKPPSLEEARRASVLRPDVAIRDAFFWTDDIILCREIAAAHKNALQDVFNEWMKESSIEQPAIEPVETGERGSLSLGFEEESAPAKNEVNPLADVPEDEKINLYQDAWTRTAVKIRKNSPSREQVATASVIGADIAVRDVFRWSQDNVEIDNFVKTYRAILKELVGGSDIEEVTEDQGTTYDAPEPPKVLNETTMMEIQFKAWTKLAEENEFELPLPDEVLAAVAINDPAIAIRDGFGWTDDASRIPSLVAKYEDLVGVFWSEWSGEARTETTSVSAEVPQAEDQQPVSNTRSGPTEEEMIQMQEHAWASAALNHGFQKPSLEQLPLAMKMTPQEAIARLFGWTSNKKQMDAVCATFESALEDISQKYIQKYSLPSGVSIFPRQQNAVKPPQQQAPSEAEDVFQVALDAWTAVAKKNGYETPDQDQILFALSVGAEDAIISGFEWASEPEDVQRIMAAYQDELKGWHSKRASPTPPQAAEKTEDELPMFTVVHGTEHWVQSLLAVEMQCAVVSYLSREQVDVLLEVSGLSHLFGPNKRVSSSNNYSRDVDQLLGAALRVERRPDHCVVFDSSPHSSVAAHDVEMRSVGIIGAFPRYDLLTADSTAGSFDDLTAMNIRRLFAERVYDQPMVDMQQNDPERVTRAKTKFYWEGDE